MQMPSITELEQERLRRERDRIMKAPQLPDIRITERGMHYTAMMIGPFRLEIHSQLGQERDKRLALDVWDEEIEDKLFKLFPDPAFVERAFNHVVKILEEDMRKANGTFTRYHKKKL